MRQRARACPLLILFGVTIAFSIILGMTCSADSNSTSDDTAFTVQDFEGYEYRTVEIGDQVWMAENLRTEYTADGTPLERVFAFANQEANVPVYGRLYEYDAAVNAAPVGWHLPSDEEWGVLEVALGVEAGIQFREGGGLGFDAIYGGYRNRFGAFESLDRWGSYWSSTLFMSDHGHIRNIVVGATTINRWGSSIHSSLSVRYVKD
jgi:uncharacterized protein (TIGR02145 family)